MGFIFICNILESELLLTMDGAFHVGVWLPFSYKAVITSGLYLITQGLRYMLFSLGFRLYFCLLWPSRLPAWPPPQVSSEDVGNNELAPGLESWSEPCHSNS